MYPLLRCGARDRLTSRCASYIAFCHVPIYGLRLQTSCNPKPKTEQIAMQPKYLIWGEHGWIAGHLHDLLSRQNKDVHATSVRMQDPAGMNQVLDEIKPTHVINCAGKTGRPNVDWCEDNKQETIESNVVGTMMLTQACWLRKIHLTVMATGCMCAFPGCRVES